MSDDEFAEEETTSNTSKKGDEAFAKAKAGLSKSDLDDQAGFFIFKFPATSRINFSRQISMFSRQICVKRRHQTGGFFASFFSRIRS